MDAILMGRRLAKFLSMPLFLACFLCKAQSVDLDENSLMFMNTIDFSQLGSVQIRNTGEEEASFRFEWNEKGMFRSTAEMADYIREMPEEYRGEPLVRKVWRFTRAYRYHNVPLAEQCWYSSNPVTMINSLGFGFCGDVAALNYVLWSELGFPVRYWDLGGVHVVSEVNNNGKWEMYDSDCEVYYLNRNLEIASVEEISLDTSLVTSPIRRFDFDTLNSLGLNSIIANYANRYAYSTYVASAYVGMKISSDDPEMINVCRYANYTEPPEGYAGGFLLPPGATMRILGKQSDPPVVSPYNVDQGWRIDHYANLSIEIPGSWKGKFPFLPLIVQTIDGNGSVTIRGNNGLRVFEEEIEIGSPELDALLETYWTPTDGIEIETQGGMTIEFLISPLWFESLNYNLLALSGSGIDDLDLEAFTQVVEPVIETGGNSETICSGGLELRTTFYGGLQYSWFLNGEAIEGESYSSIRVYKEGTYSVQLLTPSGKVIGQSAPRHFEEFAIPDINFSDDFFIFPGDPIDISDEIKDYMEAQHAGFELQWMFNSDPLGPPRDLQSTELIPPGNGTYQAIVSNDFCTTASSEFRIIWLNDDYSVNGYNIRFHPNPFMEKLTLEFIHTDQRTMKEFSAELFTPQGQLLWSASESDKPYMKYEIDGSTIASGAYVMQVSVGEERKTIKLIKR